MKKEKLEKIQKKLELVTRKWWFFLSVLLILGLLVVRGSWTIALKDFSHTTSEIHENLFAYSLLNYCGVLGVIFKVISIIVFVSLIFLKNRVVRIFNIYIATSYILFAFLVAVGFTKEYGLVVYPYPFILLLIIALFWFWEVIVGKNDFTPKKRPLWKYWVIPFVVYVFGYCIYQHWGNIFIFTTTPSNLPESGFDFFTMIPLHLSILTLYYPNVNMVTFRITTLIGLFISFSSGLHMFLLHPLFVYGLVLSFKKTPTEKISCLSLWIIFIILLSSLIMDSSTLVNNFPFFIVDALMISNFLLVCFVLFNEWYLVDRKIVTQ